MLEFLATWSFVLLTAEYGCALIDLCAEAPTVGPFPDCRTPQFPNIRARTILLKEWRAAGLTTLTDISLITLEDLDPNFRQSAAVRVAGRHVIYSIRTAALHNAGFTMDADEFDAEVAEALLGYCVGGAGALFFLHCLHCIPI